MKHKSVLLLRKYSSQCSRELINVLFIKEEKRVGRIIIQTLIIVAHLNVVNEKNERINKCIVFSYNYFIHRNIYSEEQKKMKRKECVYEDRE